MTHEQLDKLADKLSDKYGLSPQLTYCWLRETPINPRALKKVQIAKLIEFARV